MVKKAKVLVVGSGGREHALAWKLAQSEYVDEVICAPGNGGTELEEKVRNIYIDVTKGKYFGELLDYVKDQDVNMTVVGPERSLAIGLVDFLIENGVMAYGPTQLAARVESSKGWASRLMTAAEVPQAEYKIGMNLAEVRRGIEELATDKGVVVKVDGLAAGKGAVVYDSKEEALAGVEGQLRGYGGGGVVYERLFGEEVSILGFADGRKVVPIRIGFQDHKTIGEADQGPNTGGMGAYGPANHVATPGVIDEVAEMMQRTVEKMRERDLKYGGILYAGVMVTDSGPKILEYNCRFGDPECQPAMQLLDGDLYEILSRSLHGSLDEVNVKKGSSCCVVMASQGYPGSYETGKSIRGLNGAEKVPGVKIFHAGTRFDGNSGHSGVFYTNGGRVLSVTAEGADLAEARNRAYESISWISADGPGLVNRRDIGVKGL